MHCVSYVLPLNFCRTTFRSLKEAHDKFAKDHALMSAGFEAKESALKAQLASLQRLLETSKLEKKQLDGKLAQVGRDLRSQGETIKVI